MSEQPEQHGSETRLSENIDLAARPRSAAGKSDAAMIHCIMQQYPRWKLPPGMKEKAVRAVDAMLSSELHSDRKDGVKMTVEMEKQNQVDELEAKKQQRAEAGLPNDFILTIPAPLIRGQEAKGG